MILHIRTGDLATCALFTVVRHLAIDVFLVTAFIHKHILAILQNEQKEATQTSTPVSILEEENVSTNAVFTKTTKNAYIKTHFDAKELQGLVIK